MATQVQSFIVTIPAGTPAAAPVTIDVSFAQAITDRVAWAVPKGSNGLMGWRLTSGGAQVIPATQGAWIIAPGEAGVWELAELHNTGAWQVTGYNTGANPHTVKVQFHTRPITQATPLAGSLAWMQTTPPGKAMLAVGALANAPAVVNIPRAALWPPPGRG